MAQSYAEAKRSIRYKLCLRHPLKRLEVGIDRETGEYVPQCNDCVREGFEEPLLEKQPDRAAERLGEMVGHSLPAVREVTVMPVPVGQEQRAMTIEEFDVQLNLIKHVVKQMEEGVHYGVIPGTRDKSLWEPGAEYLRAAFRISWSYELAHQIEDFETGDFRYEFRCFTVPPTQPAEWVASAWSRERKFWCSRDCPRDCQQTHGPLGMERAMLPHNVKDRALKRGFVALMRNVTGTSGWFKQALDTETGEVSVSASLVCPTHNVAWFKRGKMKGYAHPIGDSGDWCNMPDKAGATLTRTKEVLDDAIAEAQDDQDGASEPGAAQDDSQAALQPFSGKTLGDLWNYGVSLGYKTKAAMLTAIGVKDDALIGDLQEAAKKLAAKAKHD